MVKFIGKMPNKVLQSNSNSRPPVVVILGHVDHGKTKLLDTIRKTNVAEKESGGITQHIGAYQIDVMTNDQRPTTRTITFLDTPGHEAFSAIRSRGAKVADIAVLVIAADEGVKPQTKEAISIIKEQKMPFVVAINKIDKDSANSQKVKQDLAGEEIFVEDWGGKVPVVEISAKSGKNIPELLDMILLLAELEDLKEDFSLPSQGVIIESNLDKRRGYVATGLVMKGTLRLGDWIVSGTVIGKIKSLQDFKGDSILEAGPSQPVLIVGWTSPPEIGRTFTTAYSKDEASKLQADNVDLTPLFQFFRGMKEEETVAKKSLNLVLKSDVRSSLEALDNILKRIKSDEVGYRVVNYDIGNISESDVQTAIASKSQIVGFRVGVDEATKRIAEKEGVKIIIFDVIYNLIEYIRSEMASLLDLEVKKNIIGKLKVLAIFKKDSKFQIIGGKVTSGKILRGAMADIVKDGNVVTVGKISQLQHNKEDVLEVKEGLEAGLRIDNLGKEPQEIKEGDALEIFEEENIARTL